MIIRKCLLVLGFGLCPSLFADSTTVELPKTEHLSGIEIISNQEEEKENVSGASHKVSNETIELTQPSHTQEALARIPGINATSDDGVTGNRLNIGIRGLSPRRSSKVMVMEDGIPIQPALYIYPNLYYNPPAERLDEIEILKGSGAIKYGPQTMGGVINYITQRPRSEFGGKVKLTAGHSFIGESYGALIGTYAEIGGFGTETLHPEVQLLYKEGEGHRDNNHHQTLNATLKLNWFPNDNEEFYFKANFNHQDMEATYTGLTEYDFERDPTFNPKENDEFVSDRLAIDVIHTEFISDNLIGVEKAYFNYFDRNWWREDDILVNANTGSSFGTLYDLSSPLSRVGNGTSNFGNLRTFHVAGVEKSYEWMHSAFGAEGYLDLGGRYHWERFRNRLVLGSSPESRDEHFTTTSTDSEGNITEVIDTQNGKKSQNLTYETSAFSFYLMETLTWGNFTLEPGWRLEWFEQSKIDLLNGSKLEDKVTMTKTPIWYSGSDYFNVPGLPSLGFQYKIDDKTQLFGGVHRGFSPPTDATFKTLQSFDPDEAFTDILPEYSWNTELGFRFNNGLITTENTLFHLRIENILSPSRGISFTQLGEAQTYGLESEGSLYLAKQSLSILNIKWAYTFTMSEILNGSIVNVYENGALQSVQEVKSVEGNELPYVPNHNLVLRFEMGQQFKYFFEMQAVSEAEGDVENSHEFFFTNGQWVEANRGDTGPIPAHTTFNIGAMYKMDAWTFNATVKNVLDEIYVGSRLHSESNSPTKSSGILPGPRRQANLSVTYEF